MWSKRVGLHAVIALYARFAASGLQPQDGEAPVSAMPAQRKPGTRSLWPAPRSLPLNRVRLPSFRSHCFLCARGGDKREDAVCSVWRDDHMHQDDLTGSGLWTVRSYFITQKQVESPLGDVPPAGKGPLALCTPARSRGLCHCVSKHTKTCRAPIYGPAGRVSLRESKRIRAQPGNALIRIGNRKQSPAASFTICFLPESTPVAAGLSSMPYHGSMHTYFAPGLAHTPRQGALP